MSKAKKKSQVKELKIRDAQFALRLVMRKTGMAGIVYRRQLDEKGRDRLKRIGAISPLAFTASVPLLRDVLGLKGNRKFRTGPFYPLGKDEGAKVACFALLAHRISDADRLFKASLNIRNADSTEVAWWLGRITRDHGIRALRALRILLEAVK